MSVKLQGRLFSKERLLEDNRKVTFYTISTVKGYYGVNFDRKIDLRKLEVPGLVEINVTSAKEKTNVTDDGRTFINKSVYVTEVKQLETCPEFEEFEQRKLEDKLGI